MVGMMTPALPPMLGPGVALVLVLLLMSGLAALAKRLKLSRLAAPQGALTLRAVLVLDSRRRVYLVAAEDRVALILAGGDTDCIQLLPPAHASPPV